ncbi:hypothetical protein SprV_0401463400 [Sparganum proliferum]
MFNAHCAALLKLAYVAVDFFIQTTELRVDRGKLAIPQKPLTATHKANPSAFVSVSGTRRSPDLPPQPPKTNQQEVGIHFLTTNYTRGRLTTEEGALHHPHYTSRSPFDTTSDLAIETIQLLLQSKYDERENRLGRVRVLQLLKFCLRTYFTLDGTIYEEVKGTPMGSPISGFIAEAVLQRLESLVFQHHRPKFWARYVDDTFVVIERDQVLTFEEHLNAVFPDVQFTMEEEENNQLAFLDVLVCRKDCGGLKTKVFRKATNTMQVLNVNSNHPISHKRSCVRTLYRHCSEPEDKIA